MSNALHDDALEWLASDAEGSPYSAAEEQRLADEDFRQREIREVWKLAGRDSHADGYIDRGTSLGDVMREMARLAVRDARERLSAAAT